MTIICSGSLVFDRIMTFPGLFSDFILPEKLNLLSISLLVDKVNRVYGGTAGNICYNLHLLGKKPLVVGSLGDDPDGDDYFQRLESWGVLMEGMVRPAGQLTASATIATDKNNSQFTFFHPGAMLEPSGYDPASLSQPHDQHLAIVSPGGMAEMKNLCGRYRELGIPFIFDPGQQIPAFSGPELAEMLDGSYIFTCNEYEYELFQKMSGLKGEELFQHTQAIIVTKGENGSDLMLHSRGSQHIMPVKPSSVCDPTGAGDAFRAGLITALTVGESLVTACRFGSTVASFCVESEGTQSHLFSVMEAMSRHARAFKEHLNLI